MSGWYLQKVSIEGFRSINNEGAPLVANVTVMPQFEISLRSRATLKHCGGI